MKKESLSIDIGGNITHDSKGSNLPSLGFNSIIPSSSKRPTFSTTRRSQTTPKSHRAQTSPSITNLKFAKKDTNQPNIVSQKRMGKFRSILFYFFNLPTFVEQHSKLLPNMRSNIYSLESSVCLVTCNATFFFFQKLPLNFLVAID